MRVGLVGMLLVALPQIVVAQTPPARDTAVALPGMTVTVTRRATSIIATPLAVS